MSDSEKTKRDKFANRTRARAVALQILFQEELNPGSAAVFGETYINEELPDNEPLRLFCRALVSGTRLHREAIDRQIADLARHWSLERMAATDRNILRLAVFEMLYQETPRPVVINEAVNLAKTFGDNSSAAFVNGILDKVTSHH